MIKIIDENATHVLRREYMKPSQGGYWFECIERASGLAQIMTSQDKNVFNGVTVDKFIKWCKSANIEKLPMYKKGII